MSFSKDGGILNVCVLFGPKQCNDGVSKNRHVSLKYMLTGLDWISRLSLRGSDVILVYFKIKLDFGLICFQVRQLFDFEIYTTGEIFGRSFLKGWLCFNGNWYRLLWFSWFDLLQTLFRLRLEPIIGPSLKHRSH